MRRPQPYRLTYRDRITLRKAVEGSLLRSMARRRHPRLTLLSPGEMETADTEPAPPPNSDWDTETPPSDPPADPDLQVDDFYDPAARTDL